MFEIENKDLNIIKQFIELYEKIESKYKEYCIICDSIRKNILFQQYDKNKENIKIEEIFETLKKEQYEKIKQEQDEYRKNLIKEQIKLIEKEVNELKKYKKIENLYNMMYYGNLSNYFEAEEQTKELPTKEYKKEIKPTKDIYFNKKSTITQIYIRVKYLYEEPNKPEKLDNEILNNIIEFYKKFKQPIKKFIDENYESIINTLKEIEKPEQIEQTKIQRTK